MCGSVTMDLKKPKDTLWRICPRNPYELSSLPAVHRAIASAMSRGIVLSCHDISDGGTAVAAAEMCIASGLGLSADFAHDAASWLEEIPGSYLVEVPDRDALYPIWKEFDLQGVEFYYVADVIEQPMLQNRSRGVPDEAILVADLRRAWRGTLDW